jgi:hypothetical protein
MKRNDPSRSLVAFDQATTLVAVDPDQASGGGPHPGLGRVQI